MAGNLDQQPGLPMAAFQRGPWLSGDRDVSARVGGRRASPPPLSAVGASPTCRWDSPREADAGWAFIAGEVPGWPCKVQCLQEAHVRGLVSQQGAQRGRHVLCQTEPHAQRRFPCRVSDHGRPALPGNLVHPESPGPFHEASESPPAPPHSVFIKWYRSHSVSLRIGAATLFHGLDGGGRGRGGGYGLQKQNNLSVVYEKRPAAGFQGRPSERKPGADHACSL